MTDYETAEGVGQVGGGVQTVEEARRLHHLASADPERDGAMTGPAHEKLYGLEREAESAALWRAAGVHPYENRALVGDEEGAENVRGVTPGDLENATPATLETARATTAPENTASPKAAPAQPASSPTTPAPAAS